MARRRRKTTESGRQAKTVEIYARLDAGDLSDLAAAIRRGDRIEAEYLMDRMFEGNDRLKWAIFVGRSGGRAKAA